MCRGVVGGRRWRTGGLVVVLLVCVVLFSAAAMAGGARTIGAVVDGTGAGGNAPGPAVTLRADAAGATSTTAPLVATTAATTTTATSEQSAPVEDADPYKDSKRKVPNGPDPIHNRRARWGDAPARRVWN
ncbi:hypothetical protein ABZP36_019857 [Zizania latifolia]